MNNRTNPVYSPPTKQIYSEPIKVMEDPYPYEKKIYHQEPKVIQNTHN